MKAAALALAGLIACHGGGGVQPAPPAVVGNDPVTDGTAPGPAPAPAPDPGDPGDLVLLARITDAGPIGDGTCSQRSYQVKIDKVEAGPAPMKLSLWIHYESCGGAAPPAGDLAGTGLDVGTTYRFTVHKATSGGFAGDFVIVSAHLP